MKFSQICMVGLGYIGLPTAIVFALRGARVIGLDVSEQVVASVNEGTSHIVEPGLDDALRRVVAAGNLRATTNAEPADAFLIAVPTPFQDGGSGREPDLRFILSASRAIAPVLKPGDLVILESTSPVGATEKMAKWLAASRPDLTFPQQAGEQSDIRIAHCPERILPGRALEELVSNDRIIGGMTPICAARAKELYEIAVTGDCVVTDCRTAELAKLAENSFRDVNIAFANELSLICARYGINVWELIRLANRHPRVNILQPGPGVGGHCIAVDPWFIVSGAPQEARLIRTAREVNDHKPEWVLEQVGKAAAAFGATHGRPARIACFGLAFKPNIDDLRESPAVAIATEIANRHPGLVDVVEPFITDLPKGLIGRVSLKHPSEAVRENDILVMLVDHDDFKMMPIPSDPNHHLIDTRGIWSGMAR